MACRELVSNPKIMHALSAIVNDCIYGNDEKRGLMTCSIRSTRGAGYRGESQRIHNCNTHTRTLYIYNTTAQGFYINTLSVIIQEGRHISSLSCV